MGQRLGAYQSPRAGAPEPSSGGALLCQGGPGPIFSGFSSSMSPPQPPTSSYTLGQLHGVPRPNQQQIK